MPAWSTFLDWIQGSPTLSLLIVFLVAMSESLALVGMIVPGAFLMVSFGALIATGYLPFWPTVLVATLGAVAGDGLSYLLGAHYNQRLANIWPFTRYPDLIPQGKRFFAHHGSKSVLLGRFFGPLRAVIPAIAGMLHMPKKTFFAVNLLSAILWAPVYLLPGILFGASLELAAEFAGRFTLLLVILLVLIWLNTWLVKKIYRWIAPRTDQLMQRLIDWSQRHPVTGRIPAAILVPEQSEIRGLSLLAMLLTLSTFGFVLISQLSSSQPILYNLDLLLWHTLQSLRSPPIDHVMVFVSSLANFNLLAAFTLLVASVMFMLKRYQALWHWLLAFAFPATLIASLQAFGLIPEQVPLTPDSPLSYLDPRTTLATVVYGFSAILVTRQIPFRGRPYIYLATSLGILLIAFSQLYLGLAWFSDVLGGLFFASAWTALVGIAYRRHATAAIPLQSHKLAWLPLLVLPVLIYAALVHERDFTYHNPVTPQTTLSQNQWLSSGWSALPASRHDLRGYNDFAFTLQIAASEKTLRNLMQQAGWQIPQDRDMAFLNIFNPQARLTDLPIPEHVHAGKYEKLRWIKPQTDSLEILRLWPATVHVDNGQQTTPLWYGYLSRLTVSKLPGIRYLKTDQQYPPPLAELRQLFSTCEQMIRQRQAKPVQRVLLISCR